MPERRIRVVLGDHALNAEGLSAVLKGVATLNVVATADSPRKLTEAVKSKSPDVVIVDSEMLRAITGRGINGKSKVIQIADADAFVRTTPATRAVVRRTETSKALKEAIRRVAKGQTYEMPDAKGSVKLSRREQEIAKLVGRGLTNRIIAEELQLSEQSVKNLVSRVLKKAGLDNRVQLALARL
ncbi:MAG: response regulator transcription factor [Fimbriimonadales bacterium]